ncbi:MAG: hypothetical protein HC767_01115 [Akkermansiaceae bacterium]|nr:hypothetical protein [Akkermansiaceae bacterium]
MHHQNRCSKKYKPKIQFFTHGLLANGLNEADRFSCIAAREDSRLSRGMLRRFAVPFILITAILFATFGLTRLRFDTDILSMLPSELPEVKGLKAFHEAFSRSDELILVIQGGEDDAGTLAVAAESLGKN